MDELMDQYRSHLIEKIRDLEQARSLLEAHQPGIGNEIKKWAHSLKGSGETYGFKDITIAAKTLEGASETEFISKVDDFLVVLRRTVAGTQPLKNVILIVDDDEDITAFLEKHLKGADEEIVIAHSAAEAERFLGEKKISLMVLDLMLPDRDGRELLSQFQARLATNMVPVIVFSGKTNAEIKAECFELGADTYFEKPLNVKVIASAIKSKLTRRSEFVQSARQDLLTGVPNRNAFSDAFRRMSLDAVRERKPLSLVLLQVDDLDSCDEVYDSHLKDEIRRWSAERILKPIRGSDFIARWGSDELGILFRNTTGEQVLTILKRTLATFLADHFKTKDAREFKISFSAGVVSFQEGNALDELMLSAYRLLHRARMKGKGVFLTPQDDTVPIKARVLLVEDDELIASVVKHRFGREDWDVEHYHDGMEAYIHRDQIQASLVVLDVKLPGMDGFELLRNFRNDARFSKIPIVMLTGMGSEKDVVRGLELGANDYILKPFSPSELMARIRRFLRVST